MAKHIIHIYNEDESELEQVVYVPDNVEDFHVNFTTKDNLEISLDIYNKE